MTDDDLRDQLRRADPAPATDGALMQPTAHGTSPDGGWRADLTGRGQVVAVADTGLDRGATDDDTLHPDFRGRVRALRPRGRAVRPRRGPLWSTRQCGWPRCWWDFRIRAMWVR